MLLLIFDWNENIEKKTFDVISDLKIRLQINIYGVTSVQYKQWVKAPKKANLLFQSMALIETLVVFSAYTR